MPKKIIQFQNTIISTEVFACTNIHFCLLIHHVRKVISFSNHSKQSIPNDHLHWKFSMLIAKSELNISYKQFWKWLNDWKLIPKIHSNRKITNTVYWMHVCVVFNLLSRNCKYQQIFGKHIHVVNGQRSPYLLPYTFVPTISFRLEFDECDILPHIHISIACLSIPIFLHI